MTTEEHESNSPQAAETVNDPVSQSRREFLFSLGKWSKAVIAGAVLGSGLLYSESDAEAGGWINRRGGWGGGGGGGWINGGGGGWINRRGGGWGGGSWINR